MTLANTWLEVVTWGATLIGGTFALIKWREDRAVTRAEHLERLLKRYGELGVKQKLKDLEEVEFESECEDQPSSQSESFTEVFDFLSYVYYLNANGVITNCEFAMFRHEIVSFLENEKVKDCIRTTWQGIQGRGRGDAFGGLVECGARICNGFAREFYQKLLDGSVENAQCQRAGEKQLINGSGNETLVKSGDVFRTHLDVLNGIFRMDYLAHMRGAARVGKNKLVWFANMINDVPPIGKRDIWYNEWDETEGVIREYWPSDAEERVKPAPKEELRYAFGKYLGKHSVEYRFLGVFTFIGVDKDIRCREFKLQRKEILKNDL